MSSSSILTFDACLGIVIKFLYNEKLSRLMSVTIYSSPSLSFTKYNWTNHWVNTKHKPTAFWIVYTFLMTKSYSLIPAFGFEASAPMMPRYGMDMERACHGYGRKTNFTNSVIHKSFIQSEKFKPKQIHNIWIPYKLFGRPPATDFSQHWYGRTTIGRLFWVLIWKFAQVSLNCWDPCFHSP